MRKKEKTTRFTLEDRLNFGVFRVDEAAELAHVSRSKIYLDAQRGLIKLHKRGARSDILGPDLRAYIQRGA